MKKTISIILILIILQSCATYKFNDTCRGIALGALGGWPWVEMSVDYRMKGYPRDEGRYDANGYYRKVMFYPTQQEGKEIFFTLFHGQFLCGAINAGLEGETRKDLLGYILACAIWGGIRIGNIEHRINKREERYRQRIEKLNK